MEDKTYEALRGVIGGMEQAILDDSLFPVVENKRCCYTILEFCKYSIQFFKNLHKDINKCHQKRKLKRK